MVPFLDCREIVYLSFAGRQSQIAPIRSHSGRIFYSYFCSIYWDSRGTCTDTCVREGRSEAQRPPHPHPHPVFAARSIPCHLSLRQGKGKRAFFLYRVTHLIGNNLSLTVVWEVQTADEPLLLPWQVGGTKSTGDCYQQDGSPCTTSSVHGRKARTRNNQSTITSTIRIGLGNSKGGGRPTRPLASPFPSRSERTYSSRIALIFPESGMDGEREIHSCRPSVRSVGQVEFPSKRQFSF